MINFLASREPRPFTPRRNSRNFRQPLGRFWKLWNEGSARPNILTRPAESFALSSTVIGPCTILAEVAEAAGTADDNDEEEEEAAPPSSLPPMIERRLSHI
eukprot:CAMPEP_0198682018 /NCGR_PEP_ID=MMETSP1468-20131203/7914_1 /TAXON_ID=1461545 /ORGANISM="Mantoniella sp, Strain CCMP1436" /LENGTH=100 /DNA_ID=CAMNT_0044424465 /DNA_START=782 /DNA_END=1084 /DNA_ORIENTATION=-